MRNIYKRYTRKDLKVFNVLKWGGALLVVVISGILIASCSTTGGSATTPTTLVIVWNSDQDLGGAGTDNDIFFSRSTDRGSSWSGVQILNSTATSDSNTDGIPQARTDGKGTWVVVWESSEDFNSAGTDFDIFFSRSTDDGVSWSDTQVLNSTATSDTDAADIRPRLMTDGNGTWVVVWASGYDMGGTAGTDLDIFFSRSTDNGATWSVPQVLNTNATSDTGYDYWPSVMTDGNGIWVTVWHSNDYLVRTIGTDMDILFSRSTNNGMSWSAPQALNSNADSDTGYDYLPAVMTDGNGVWVTVWFSAEDFDGANTDYDIFFSRSTNDGANWSDVQLLNSNATSDSGSDRRPALMTDGEGTWTAVWFSSEDLDGAKTDNDIFFTRSTDNGSTWSDVQFLNSNAASATGSDDIRPMVLFDGLETWVTVWESSEDVGGADTDDDIFFSRSTDNGSSWGASQALNSNAAKDTGDDQFAYVGD
jgi:Neuraminidase (sialidase)